MSREPDAILHPEDSSIEAAVRRDLDVIQSSKHRRMSRFTLAALSGLPWVGGVLGAAAAYDSEREQGRVNELQGQWLDEHRKKLREVAETLDQIGQRVEELGEEAKARLESEEYLTLVRKAFRTWDEADTKEKRDFIRKLLENAAGTPLAPDDVVRLFIQWIETYHEAHFAIVRAVYRASAATRAEIWQEIYGDRVREDSAEADLFSLLMRDLSMGGVIRQDRETTSDGRFVAKRAQRAPRRAALRTMKSLFDDTEDYVLTELGEQFVHYVFTGIVRRVGASGSGA